MRSPHWKGQKMAVYNPFEFDHPQVDIYEHHYYVWYCSRCATKNVADVDTKRGNELRKCYRCKSSYVAGKILLCESTEIKEEENVTE